MSYRKAIAILILPICTLMISIPLIEFVITTIRIPGSFSKRLGTIHQFLSNSVENRWFRISQPLDMQALWDPFVERSNDFEKGLYRIDALGRREIEPAPIDSSQFLVFMGSSFVFGQEVMEKDTFPSLTQKLIKNFTVYNYGLLGGSPISHLVRLASLQYRKDIAQPKGTFVFVTTTADFYRVLTIPSNVTWLDRLPYFVDDLTKGPGFYKDIRSIHPLKWIFYKYLDQSTFAKYLKEEPEENFLYKPQLAEMCRVIELMKLEIKNQFPLSKFILLNLSKPFEKEIEFCAGQKSLDGFLSIFFDEDPRCQMPKGHFSPGANRYVAERMSALINKTPVPKMNCSY